MEKEPLEIERNNLVQQLTGWLETPMLVLGFVWLALLVVDLTRGLNPLLDAFATLIWAIFVVEFALRFLLAPHKLPFLKDNWITAVALLLPALRILRVARLARAFRAARAARGVRLFRVISSINRGMRALAASLGRRGFGYVAGLTAIVTFAGAAGMYEFERGVSGQTVIRTYGDALWWTAMLMTTMGSEYWPQSAEGRLLCLLLALYAFAVFGYVTATFASYFVGRDAESPEGEAVSAASVEKLREEILALREEIRRLSR